MTAEEFSTSKVYAAGELVMYNGTLYRFTSAHSAGAWNSAEVKAVDPNTKQIVTRIMSSYQRDIEAAAYAEKIVFDAEQIIETRYQYTFMDN